MKQPNQSRRRLLAGATAALALGPLRRPRAGLPVEEHARRHPDRAGRRRRAARALLRRSLEQAPEDQLRVQLLRRRGRPGRLRDLRPQAREGRLQPALRQHGAGDDHVRAAEAERTASPRTTSTSAAPTSTTAWCSRCARASSSASRTWSPRRRSAPVNVAVSRLPHPASIGMLALGAALGAKFNLDPLRRRQPDHGGGAERRGRLRRAADRRRHRAARADEGARRVQRREPARQRRATTRRRSTRCSAPSCPSFRRRAPGRSTPR